MYLSTSSFRNEIKVIGLVLLVLLGAELFLRTREESLSVDVKHIRQIPAISKSMVEGEELHILFLGNSTTRYGVDPITFDKEMGARGVSQLHIERVFPDATSLVDWYYAFKRYFVDAGRAPDVLIVGFSGTDLQDSVPARPARLARHFTSVNDIPEIFSEDVTNFDNQAEFLLSDLSVAFANRSRVHERVLDMIVPNYRETAQILNQTVQATEGHLAGRAPQVYRRLQRLLKMAQQHGVQVVFVAMPLKDEYSLDPQIQSTIEAAGMTLIDGRMVEGISGESYVDRMHMNVSGAATYSRFLARQLAGRIQQTSDAETTSTLPQAR